VIRFLIGGLMLASASSAVFAAEPSSPMRFEWHSEEPTDARCNKACRTWIAAVGTITERTPRDFAAFARDRDVRGAVLVLDSDGGSVVGTMEFGRALRRLQITTTVGKTVTGSSEGRTTISPAASCESMCGFVLLGGLRRYVPPEARVLVHQIWLAKKRDDFVTTSYAADELSLVEHDIGRLASYTIEMGGDIEFLDTALRIPPWEPLYRLSQDEVRRMGLNNIDHLFVDETRNEATTSTLVTPTAAMLPPN